MAFLSTLFVSALILTAPSPAEGTAEYYVALPESVHCVEAETGLELVSRNADVRRPPASMIKMIMMLMVDEGVEAKKWSYDTPIAVSKNAEGMGGTQVYLKMGEKHPLEALMLAIAVASANDASMAVAEGLWGSKEKYLEACNRRAQELGMTQSVFHSVHGLPPSKGESFDLTTARDMALLGRACVARPKILEWTSRRELVFRESDGVKASTNKLLGVVPGCDGIKTGFIRAAGFCITATAARDGVRVIAVVMGNTKRGRFESAQEVLEQGLGMVTRVRPVTAGMTVGRPVPVTNGVVTAVSLSAREGLETVVLKADAGKLQLMVSAPSALEAPVSAGAEVGGVKLVLGDKVLGETALLTASGTEAKTLWRRMMDKTGLSR